MDRGGYGRGVGHTVRRWNMEGGRSNYRGVLCRLQWIRTNVVLGESEVVVTWDVPETAVEGTYRIKHFGYYRYL